MPLPEGREILRASIGSKSVEVAGGYTASVYDLNRSELRKAVAYAFRHVAPEAVWRNATNVEMIEAIVTGVVPASAKTSNQYGTRMATDKQKWRLVNKHGFGRSEVDRMTFTEASKAIQAAIDAEERRQGYKAPVPFAPDPQLEQMLREEEAIERRIREGKNEISRDPMIPNQSGDLAEIKSTLNSLVDTVDVLAANQAKASSILSGLSDRVSKLETDMASVTAMQPKVIEISIGERPVITVTERQHEVFPDVLAMLSIRRNVLLVGPPGTGKSTLFVNVAKAMELPYGDISFGPTTPESRLMGFVDANGVCRDTEFERIFTGGGVWNFDELDNGHPGIIAVMNTALSNGHCTFASGHKTKHPDTLIGATANTNGTGPTRAFSGRNTLDAATLDRFSKVVVGYDEVLEAELVRATWDDPQAIKWLEFVREWREKAEQMMANGGPVAFFTPRASIDGAMMLRIGMEWEKVAEYRLWNGLSEDCLRRLRAM